MATYGSGPYGAGLYSVATAITAVEQGTYPAKITLTVTGVTAGDAVTIRRHAAGVVDDVLVRSADDLVMLDTSIVLVDAEQPFGTTLTYLLYVDDVYQGSSSPLVSTLAGGNVALSDAISGAAAEVTIRTWSARKSDRVSSVFATIGGRRTVLVSGQTQGATSTLTLFTETATARDNLRTLVDAATSGILLLRAPDAKYTGTNCYIGILSISEIRFSDDGSDDRRLWELEIVELTGWADSLTTAGASWQDVINVYAGLTWGQVQSDFASWLLFEGYDWEGAL
jgi:hypothetical protein